MGRSSPRPECCDGPRPVRPGAFGSSGAGATGRPPYGTGAYDPDDAVFDIADDRRDDGTTMSQAPGRGAVPPPPPRSSGFPPASLPPAQRDNGYEPGGYDTGGYETGRHEPGGYDTGGYSSVGSASFSWAGDTSHVPYGYGAGDPSDGRSPSRHSAERPSEPSSSYDTGRVSRYYSPAYDSPGYDSPSYDCVRVRLPRLRRRPADDGRRGTPRGYAGGSEGFGLPTPREAAPAPASDASDMVAIIRTSFEAVAPRADELTQLFYGWLFRIAPETRELFPVTMELQRTRLLRALIHFVQMVDRPDELTVFLRQLGRDHRKFGVVGRALRQGRRGPRSARSARSPGRCWTRRGQVRPGSRAYGMSPRPCATPPTPSAARPCGWRGSWSTAGWPTTSPSSGSRPASPCPTWPASTSRSRPRSARACGARCPRRTHPGPDCVMEFHVHTVPGGWVSRAIVVARPRRRRVADRRADGPDDAGPALAGRPAHGRRRNGPRPGPGADRADHARRVGPQGDAVRRRPHLGRRSTTSTRCAGWPRTTRGSRSSRSSRRTARRYGAETGHPRRGRGPLRRLGGPPGRRRPAHRAMVPLDGRGDARGRHARSSQIHYDPQHTD